MWAAAEAKRRKEKDREIELEQRVKKGKQASARALKLQAEVVEAYRVAVSMREFAGNEVRLAQEELAKAMLPFQKKNGTQEGAEHF